MKRIYFDHAAATPVDARVLQAMEPFWAGEFANPSAIHKEGVLARKTVEAARKNIATLLGVHADEIVFTGSATESANLALFGAVAAWQKSHPGKTPHIIVSAIEHDAVLEPARRLEESGVRVTRVAVNAQGIVDVHSVKNAINTDTVLISVMYANNEIGTVQPISEIAKAIRKWKKEERGVTRVGKPEGDERYPLFHTDATQAVNYLDLSMPRLGVDLLTMNAAKIYGPKGIGLLAILRDTPIDAMTLGGGQERGRRAGTENVPAIVGFAEALRLTREIAEDEGARLSVLRDQLIGELKKIPGLLVNGDEHERLPNNINFSLPGIDVEFLALQLDAQGFAVATKSACNETDAETSHVLAALRAVDLPAQAGGTGGPLSGIRLSFGRETTRDHVEQFSVALRAILQHN
jgi:cysteine desulfurase